jgi:two-component system invasion response regulator UvrY
MIRVLIADDHPIVRKGLKQILSETDDIHVKHEADTCAEVLSKALSEKYDVILLDISMPGRGGVDVLKELRSLGIHTPVLILSIFPEEQYAIRALRAGASGYLTKTCAPELLIEAIRKVASGKKYVSDSVAERLVEDIGGKAQGSGHERLSDREYEVMKGIALGKSVKELAEELTLSVKTVSTYRTRVLEKMHMKSNAELIRYALEHQLVS